MNDRQELRVRKLLLPALRSGEYVQHLGSLRSATDENAFCCLGVATDIVRHDGWIGAYTCSTIAPFNDVHGTLPTMSQAFYGFSNTAEFALTIGDRRVTMPESAISASLMNDDLFREARSQVPHDCGQGMSWCLSALNDTRVPFDHIADVIEFILDDDWWSFSEPALASEGCPIVLTDEHAAELEENAVARLSELGVHTDFVTMEVPA